MNLFYFLPILFCLQTFCSTLSPDAESIKCFAFFGRAVFGDMPEYVDTFFSAINKVAHPLVSALLLTVIAFTPINLFVALYFAIIIYNGGGFKMSCMAILEFILQAVIPKYPLFWAIHSLTDKSSWLRKIITTPFYFLWIISL